MKRDLLGLSLFLLFASLLRAGTIYEPYTFVTFAGWNGHGSQDGTGPDARFTTPHSTAVDKAGNVFVTDWGNQMIRKITPAGVVTTFAGVAGETGGSDGQGSAARFNYPADIAIDRQDNLYVADEYNCTIRKITPEAVVSTVAGEAGMFGYADGTGNVARFNLPNGITLDHAGNIFVGDSGNLRVRKITRAGVVTTFAGDGDWGDKDGVGTEAEFGSLPGLGIDRQDNIYAADYISGQIRKITPQAVVTHYNPLSSYTNCQDVAVAPDGTVYVVSAFVSILIAHPEGDYTIFAGGLQGSEDGIGPNAQFNSPRGLSFSRDGTLLYVADQYNSNIRKVTRRAVVSTFAGLANLGSRDGVGTDARFFYPFGVASDSSGVLAVADTHNDTIRKVLPDGTTSTIAGKVVVPGSDDGRGNNARFDQPFGTTFDTAGNVYVADNFNQTIRKITHDGVVTTLAGQPGIRGSSDGIGNEALFNYPTAVAVDAAGYVYVADSMNFTIRKISPTGEVTTLAGVAEKKGTRDGSGAGARFDFPYGITIDGDGNLFVADTGNALIRKLTPGGVVTTIAGKALRRGSDDGVGTDATFNQPQGIASDAAGNLYVADTANKTIRKITPMESVTTLAGLPNVAGWVDDTGSEARFGQPVGIAVDAQGNIYVADVSNTCIRKGFPAGR